MEAERDKSECIVSEGRKIKVEWKLGRGRNLFWMNLIHSYNGADLAG